jgi:small neutral amino acid transporter SnatA (MarC family)
MIVGKTKRSEIISIVGAFLLIADYIVTAAISSLSAFQYLGVGHPELFAGAGIVLALSGVEAIANATSVMKLNPGSSEEHQVSCRMRSISLSMLRTGIADS